jgi:ABC-type sugar transport system permease subunit
MAHFGYAKSLALPVQRSRWWSTLVRQLRRSSLLGMGYSFVIVVYYAALFLVPFGVAVWLSFQHWDYIVEPKFAGFENCNTLVL